MKRFAFTALACALAFGLTAEAFAGAGCCSKKAADGATTASAKSCDKGSCDKASGCSDYCVEASTARLMKSMPQMSFQVGEETTRCPVTARTKAEESGKDVVFLVADKSYDNAEEAMNAWAQEIHAHLGDAAKVQNFVDGECIGCPQTAAQTAKANNSEVRYSVAGVLFNDKAKAEAVAAKLTEKMKEWEKDGCCAAATASAKSSCSGSCDKASCTGTCDKATCTKGDACCKKGDAQTASAGSCSKKEGAQKASCSGSCDKASCTGTCDKATCTKGDACCKKGDAQTASAGSCCKKDGAQKASGESCCKKGDAQTASAGSCCKKDGAQKASGEGCCKKDEAQTASAIDETPAMAQTKALVRQVVEFVAAERQQA